MENNKFRERIKSSPGEIKKSTRCCHAINRKEVIKYDD